MPETIFDVFNLPMAESNAEPDLFFKTLFTRHPIDDFVSTGMDEEYIYNRSAHKVISNIVELYLRKDGERPWGDFPTLKVLSTSAINTLADIAWNMFGDSWTKMFNALQEEYKPLENYDLYEKETPNLHHKHEVSTDYKTTDKTSTNTDVTTENINQTNDTSVYAFNSSSPVPASQNKVNGKTQTTGDEADNTVTNEHTQSGYTDDVESGQRELTRHGNIGVTTSQQMLQSEIDLRTSTHIRNIIYKDVDTLLTLPIYSFGITGDILRYVNI